MASSLTGHSLLGPIGHAGSAGGVAGGHDVLDEATLDRLRQLDPTGQNGLLQRVFKAFDSSAQRLLEQLAPARRSSDMRGIFLVAHTLKSSSQSIGALKLATVCAVVEGMVRQSNSEGLSQRLDELEAESVVVLDAVRAMQRDIR